MTFAQETTCFDMRRPRCETKRDCCRGVPVSHEKTGQTLKLGGLFDVTVAEVVE